MSMNEQFPLALPEGTVLAGQYTIEKVLGQGGFGITYRASDYKTGQKVAVKEFFPDTLAYREATTVISYPGERSENFAYGKEGFLQEARTLAAFIGNENIVRIHSYFEENGTAYFVMDYIEGISFDEYLKNRGGKISCEEAKQILVPVMDALGAVHSKGIVHRDVTPDNIYITNDGVVKLLDFGAARYSLGDKSRSLDVILKHGFAPKEQYTRRGKQGPYTDIYSLGATFYFAITGKRPPDSVDRLDEDDLIPPSNLGVQITDYQEKAILQAMSVQPSERFESMAVFKQVLLNESAVAQNNAANQMFFNAPPVPPQPTVNVQQPVQYAQQPVQYPQQTTGGVQTVQTPVGVTQAVQSPVGVTQAVQPAADVTQAVQPVQPEVDPTQAVQPAQATEKKKSKKPLFIGIAAAAVVCIGVAIAVGAGSSSNDDIGISDSNKSSGSSNSGGLFGGLGNSGEDSGSASEPLPHTAENLQIIGNEVQNLKHAGYYCESDNDFFWIDEGGKSLHSAKNGYIKQASSGYYANMSYVDGCLYYTYNAKAYMYDLSDGSEKLVPGLESYEHISNLYISKLYFYVVYSNTDLGIYTTVSRISRETGETEESLYYDEWMDVAFYGEWIYFTHQEDTELHRAKADDFNTEGDVAIRMEKSRFIDPIVDKDYVYVMLEFTDGTSPAIARYNSDLHDPQYATVWDITSVLNKSSSEGMTCFQIHGKNAFFTLCDWSTGIYTLYHITLNNDGTIDSSRSGKIVENVEFGTSISWNNNTGECHIYYCRKNDGGSSHYITFDANGNPVPVK